MSTPIELEVAYLVWKDKDGIEQVTPAHTFPSGTAMLFQQPIAPVGWTRDTTHHNKGLRVTKDSVGSGGNSSFNAVFGTTTTSQHSLTTAQIPSHAHTTSNAGGHNHTQYMRYGGWTGNWSTNRPSASANGHGAYNANGTMSNSGAHSHNTNSSGSGQGHSHYIDLRLQYVDVMIATKD